MSFEVGDLVEIDGYPDVISSVSNPYKDWFFRGSRGIVVEDRRSHIAVDFYSAPGGSQTLHRSWVRRITVMEQIAEACL